MTVKAYTSRSRFDEARRFTGVYQQMGRVSLDSDWNEEVRLRTVDARRRTADVADGSPDDGFRIAGDYLVDPITSLQGWAGQGLPAGDERIIPKELRLDRHDPEALPWVVRSRGHVAVRRVFINTLDLTQLARADGSTFSATNLIFSVRFDRPPTDDEIVDIQIVVADGNGVEKAVSAGLGQRPSGWGDVRLPVTAFAGVDTTKLKSWGVTGIPPMGRTFIAGLRAEDPALGDDVVIRGGDGTLPGAGRMLVNGVRVFIERDLRYSVQPDYPAPPPLAALPTDGSLHHFLYLDVWEQTVTGLDDPFLIEPALDGLDTTTRLRLVAQVRAMQSLAAGASEALPSAIGGGRITTNIAKGALPDRVPPEPADPCRDRCLSTANASTGEGYIGSDNLHVRVEIFQGGTQPVVLWARDNAATVLPLTAAVAPDALTLQVSPESAAKLRAGDLIVIEDRATRLQPEGPALPVLRRLRGVQADTGKLELTDASDMLTNDPTPLQVGGAVGRAFSPAQGAAVRRWDGGDRLVTGVRYRLPDGITFAFSGDSWRTADHWTFTARVRAPDGGAHGEVEQLTDAPVHGPVHHFVPLARVSATTTARAFEDLRPRFLPLAQVRDRLIELGSRVVGPGAFTVVVGDGQRSFGDVDQDLIEGVTGDEAIQAAVDLLGGQGGSIYLRAGSYTLEHPVLLRGLSGVHLLGDGDATELRTRGSGGAFYLDGCGGNGAVRIEGLRMVEAPLEAVAIGAGTERTGLARPPGTGGIRFAPLAEVADKVLTVDDVRNPTATVDFLASVGERIRLLKPGEGRAAGSVVATLIQLRKLQRLNPGKPLEEVADATPLLSALEALPHGVVTIADSSRVVVRGCYVQANEPGPQATGVLVTGTCEGIDVSENRIFASTGIAMAPYAPYLGARFLAVSPRAGLFASSVAVIGNELEPVGDGTTGIHVADGVLSGIEVRGNRVKGFHVGILVQDQAESSGSALDRLIVAENQVFDSAAVGIQIAGDGADVVGNEIRNAASDGLFQAAIQLAGRGLRVRDSWIELPAAPAAPVLGVLAGIVVGDGLDDGQSAGRAAADVEVLDNRIEGAGEATPGMGVLLGGPQPVFDVRIRGNVIRNLGDAGVRAWGGGGPVGRVRIEDNRFEQVALADVPSQVDNTAALTRLDATLAAGLSADAKSKPRALVEALLTQTTATVRAPLDAALRWMERLTLRGAVALAGVDEGWVRGNRLLQVGRSGAYAAQGLTDAEIRAAGVGAVAGSDVWVEGNEIDSVRAPVQTTEVGPGTTTVELPPIAGVLQRLGLSPASNRLDRGDVHAAVVGQRTRVLQYTGGDDSLRQQIGRGLYGPLDTIAQELTELGGTPATLSATLTREIGDFRAAQGRDQHTAAANAVRSTLSQAASLTASDETSQDAWDTAAQFDLALTNNADAILAAAARLRGGASVLVQGLPEDYLKRLLEAVGRVLGAPTDLAAQMLVAGVLGEIASLRDAQAQRVRQPVVGQVVGPRRTIVNTFVNSALQSLPATDRPAATRNLETIDQLRTSKEALVDQLKDVHPQLSTQLEADYRDVERTQGIVLPAVQRLRTTLTQIQAFASGQGQVVSDVVAEDAARVFSQGQSASINLFASTLDRQAAGLSTESQDSAEKQLRSFHTTVGQLVSVVGDDSELSGLATQVHQAVADAINQPQRRTELLSNARGLLNQIRVKTIDLLPPKPVTTPPVVVEPLDRRLSGLMALVLAVRGMAAGAALTQLLALYRDHLARALDIAGVQGRNRDLSLQAVDEAIKVLNSGAQGSSADDALHRLAVEPADTAASSVAAGKNVTPALDAAAVVLRAVEKALDPAEDAPTRVDRAQEYLRQRADKVSASLVAFVLGTEDLDGILDALRQALERLARGETADPATATTPAFDTFPKPADGVYLAGIQGRVRVSGNAVQDAVTGITIVGTAGHVLTENPPQPGMLVDVSSNRLGGCTVSGLAVSPDASAVVAVEGNHLFACAGIPVQGAPGIGQSVASFTGSGELVVRDNVFQESGNTLAHALLHEVVIDWRGQVVVRGNTIRHQGGGGGGAGLLLLTEQVPSDLVGKLALVPFLGTEPPPKPASDGRATTPSKGVPSAIGQLVSVPRPEDLLQLGNLKQQFAAAPVLNRALTMAPRTLAAPQSAAAVASRYLAAATLRPPLIDFLIRPATIVPRVEVQDMRSIHIEGNDIAAQGPALLLLSNGGAVISTTVASNELRSRGGSGAVYLRQADSTVFSGNRCECLTVVNVVVLRVGKAPVTFSGNVVLGAEPVAPKPPPTKPAQVGPGDKLTLHIPVGGGSTMAVPLDQELLLGSLERRRDVASGAFSALVAEALTPVAAPPPAAAPTGTAPTGTAPTTTVTRAGILLSPEALADAKSRLPLGMEPAMAGRTLYGIATRADDSPTTALRNLVDRVALHVGEGGDVATHVRTVLTASNGDPKAALQLVDKSILGIDSAAPTVKESVFNVSVLHEVLADSFYGGGGKAGKPIQSGPAEAPPAPPAPDPYAHSVIILGGSRVAAVGNSTTSGVHVQEADAVVEFNP